MEAENVPLRDLPRLQRIRPLTRLSAARDDGGHSSMVEPQIVVLVVAGSSPVGHPIPILDFRLPILH
jgi:hypothetical protein